MHTKYIPNVYNAQKQHFENVENTQKIFWVFTWYTKGVIVVSTKNESKNNYERVVRTWNRK